jgi:hypothetical protein
MVNDMKADLTTIPVKPKLAMSNFITDLDRLRRFAIGHGFDGIEWSFELEHLPRAPAEDSRWVNLMALLEPLELRFHCPFKKLDMGHEDSGEGERLKTKSVVESFLKKNNLLALSQNP